MKEEEDAAKNPRDSRVSNIPSSTPRGRPLQEANSSNGIGIEGEYTLRGSTITPYLPFPWQF